MNWKWNFEHNVLVLPASVLAADASPEQLRVLLWLASDGELAEKPTQLAKLAGCKREDIDNAIAFWQSCGVLTGADVSKKVAEISATEKKKSAPAESASESPVSSAKKPLQRADELPT